MPPSVDRLVTFMRMKLYARDVGLSMLGLNGPIIQLVAAPSHPTAIPLLLSLTEPLGWRLLPGGTPERVRIQMPKKLVGEERLDALEGLLTAALSIPQK